MGPFVHLIFFQCLLFLSLALKVDQTLEPNAKGLDVVEAAISKIRLAAIFTPREDFNLLSRLAFIQTGYGSSGPESDGGIWAVSATQFKQTVDNIPADLRTAIQTKFGITWDTTLAYSECRQPLKSALALSILVQLTRPPSNALQTMKDQGDFLSSSALISITSAEYVQKVTDLEKGFGCLNPLDLTIIMGGSVANGSTFQDTTTAEKRFIRSLFGSLSKTSGRIRLGLVGIQGDKMETRFSLDSPYDDQNIQWLVRDTETSKDDAADTRINEGILKGVDMLNGTKSRGPTPRFFLTFSHRQSSENGAVSNIAYTHQFGQQLHVITMSEDMGVDHEEELSNLAGNDLTHVWRTSIAGVEELARRFSEELCLQPQIVNSNSYSAYGTIRPREKRYHSFGRSDYPYHILTLYQGGNDIEMYVSYSHPHPSSAVYDFMVTGAGTYALTRSDYEGPGDGEDVFVMVRNGGDSQVEYNFRMEFSSNPPEPTTTTTTLGTGPTTTTTTEFTTSTENGSKSVWVASSLWAFVGTALICKYLF